MKCSLLFALALRAQVGHGFAGPVGGLALSNCFSAAAGASNGIVRRGVASTSLKAAASKGSDVSGRGRIQQRLEDATAPWLQPFASFCVRLFCTARAVGVKVALQTLSSDHDLCVLHSLDCKM